MDVPVTPYSETRHATYKRLIVSIGHSHSDKTQILRRRGSWGLEAVKSSGLLQPSHIYHHPLSDVTNKMTDEESYIRSTSFGRSHGKGNPFRGLSVYSNSAASLDSYSGTKRCRFDLPTLCISGYSHFYIAIAQYELILNIFKPRAALTAKDFSAHSASSFRNSYFANVYVRSETP